MATRDREAGFSLIELLVVLPIVAVLFLTMFYSVDVLTDSSQLSGWKITAAAENFKGLHAVRKDLLQALPDATGPNRYMIGPEEDWISFRVVDGEETSPQGRVVPILSPRIYIYLDDGKLIRAVVNEASMSGPGIHPDLIEEVRVLATNVADVTFGDPASHGGAFVVGLVTLAGTAENDAHVQTTNYVSITPMNRAPLTLEGQDPVPPLEYVADSRDTSGNQLAVTIRNTTDRDITVNRFQLDWVDNVGYGKEMWLGGVKYWTALNDPEEGIGPGELRAFTEAATATIPAHAEVQFQTQNFHKKRNATATPMPPNGSTEYQIRFYLDSWGLEPIVVAPAGS